MFDDAFGLPTQGFLETNPERLMNRAPVPPPVPQVVWPGRGNARTPYPEPTTSKAPTDPGDWVTPQEPTSVPDVPAPQPVPTARAPDDPGDWITPNEPQSPNGDPGDWITPSEPAGQPLPNAQTPPPGAPPLPLGIGSDHVATQPPSEENLGLTPPAPLDEVPQSQQQPYRDSLLGTAGALKPGEGPAQRDQRIAAAEAARSTATDWRRRVQDAQPALGAAETQRQLNIENIRRTSGERAAQTYANRTAPMNAPTDLEVAKKNEEQANTAAIKQHQSPAPTMTPGRNFADTSLKGLVDGARIAGTQMGELRVQLGVTPAGVRLPPRKPEEIEAWTKRAKEVVDGMLPGDAARKEDFWSSQVAQGVGSSSSFLVLGAAGKMVGLTDAGIGAVIATSGALQQAGSETEKFDAAMKRYKTSLDGILKADDADLARLFLEDKATLRSIMGPEQYDRAAKLVAGHYAASLGLPGNTPHPQEIDDIRHELMAKREGLDHTTLKRAVVLIGNAAVGATEIIPIASALERVNKLSGGAATRILKAGGINSIEEFVQETFQGWTPNEITKFTYDLAQESGEGVWDAGTVGAVIGFLQGGGIQAYHEAMERVKHGKVSGLPALPGAMPPLTGTGAPPTSGPGVTPPLSSSNAAPSGAPSGAAPSAPTTPPATTAEEAAAQIAANQTRAGTTTVTVNGKTVTVPAPPALQAPLGEPPSSVPPSGEQTTETTEASEALDALNKPVIPITGAEGGEAEKPAAEAGAKSNYDRAVEAVRERNFGSTSYVQRVLGVKYGEAARIMDQLEANGVVGPADRNSGKREVLPFAKPGTRTAPIEINTDEDVAKLGQVVRQDGSHAQGEANNIQREHADWHGHSFTMEAPAGGTRKGVAPDGTKWEQKFTHPYGYLKGIKGADGQEIDAYMLGAEPQVFVLDELDENGKFRQHKLFLGAPDSAAARKAYLGTQGKNAEQWGGGQMMTADEFKEWSKGDLTKPVVTGHRSDLNSRDVQNRTLRAFGYSQFQIDRMSPKNRAAEWKAAVEAGTKPEDFQETAATAVTADISENDTGAKAEPAQESGNVGNVGNVPPSSPVEKTNIRELEPENAPPVPEPAAEHVAAVEDEIRAEGEDPKADYLRGIAERAAGLYAQHQDKGLSYREAGQAAIAEHMINSGVITEEQAREHYGPKLLELLQAEPGGGRSVRNEAQHAPGVGANAAGAKAAEAGSKAGQAAQHGAGSQANGANAAAEATGHPANGRGDISADTAAARPVKNAQTRSGEQDSFRLQQEDAVAPPRETSEAQYVIPGAERISQAEYLARKAAEPKRAKRGMRVRSRVKEIETEPFARDDGPDNRPPPPRRKPPPRPAPMSAMTYLASRGGLKPDSELKKLGIDYKTRVVVPGQGWRNVVSKKNGMTMEQAVEVLMEGKYLPPDNARKPNDFDAHNKIRDMLSEEHRGGVKTYPMGQEDTGEQSRHERATADEQISGYEADVRSFLDETGMTPHISRADHFIHRAATIMATEGHDVDEAWNLAVMREDIDTVASADDEIHKVFDLGDLDDLYPRAVSRDEQAPSEDGVQGAGPEEAAEAAGPGERVHSEREGRSEEAAAEEVKPPTEKTAAGEQYVLPGAEKISDKEQAQRKADKPLKPKADQKPADEGLFGDTDKQTSIVEQAAKAPEPPSVKEKPSEPAPTSTKPDESAKGDDAWWKDLSPHGREMVAAAAKAGKTVAKASWGKIRPDVQAKLASVRDSDQDPNVIRDAPTWAQVLHAADRDPDLVFGMIRVVSGKEQAYSKLKPSEMHEMLRRLKANEIVEVPETPSAPSSDNVPAMSVDEASRKVEQAWTEYQGIKKKLDKLDERLERKETPRNPLDKERIDKNYALTEKFARQERKKAAAAYDAWEDAKADLKKAKAAAAHKPAHIPAPQLVKPEIAKTPQDVGDEIPDFLLRNPKKAEVKAEEKDVSSIFDDIFDELAEEQKAAEPAAEKSGERPEDQKQEENKTELPPDFELVQPYKADPSGLPLTVEGLKQWRVYAPGGFIVGAGATQEEAIAGYKNWEAMKEAKAEVATGDVRADFRRALNEKGEAVAPDGRRFKVKEAATGTWFYQSAEPNSSLWIQTGPGFPQKWGKGTAVQRVFDEAFPDSTQDVSQESPANPPKPKTYPPLQYGKDDRVSQDDINKRVNEMIKDGLSPDEAQVKVADQIINAVPRTAADAAKSAAKNVSQGTSKALDGLMKLFDPKNKLSEGGLTFDDEDWKKAKPFFVEAAHDFRNAWKDIEEFARKLVQALRERGMSIEGLRAMRPYLERFTQDVKDGKIDLNAAPETTTSESESNDERTRAEEPGPEPLDEVPAEQGGGASEGGDAGRSDTVGSGDGTEGNRPADEHGLPGEQGAGGGSSGPDNAQAGAGGRRGGRAGGRAGGNGARVPRKSTAASGPDRKRRPDTKQVEPAQAPSLPAINFKITDQTELGKGSEKIKFNANIFAIQVLKDIERENRRATPEEQHILARYVGWGGLANAFRQPDTNEFKPDWNDRGEELEGVLSKEEYRAARSSTQYAHYTSKTVIDAMWDAVKRLGFKGGIAIETSAGVGNFLGLVPSDIAGSTKFIAVEKDSISARIAKMLYPEDTVLHAPFQNVPLPDGEAALVIGNPPFSKHSLTFKNKPELTGLSMHNQFILAGLDALRPGGVQVVVVSRYLMDAKDTSAREKMAIKARLIGAIRLPDTAFKENARTEVVTDILFFQRHTQSEETRISGLIEHSHRPPKGGIAGAISAITGRGIEKPPSWIETDTVKDPLGGADMTVNSYFASNAGMVMGRMERSGTMQMSSEEGKGINVVLDGDLAPRLAEAIKRLPSDVGAGISDDVLAASMERHKAMSEALSIALSGSEVGHVERTPDGKMTQIAERETASGEYELMRREITPASPWSRELSMAADGRWYTMEAVTLLDSLNEQAANIRTSIEENRVAQNVAVEAKLRGDLEKVLIAISKAKPGELVKHGKKNFYARKYFENNEVPNSMRLGQAKYDRLVDIVNLRDLTRQQLVLEAEDAPAAQMEANRKKLAKAYQTFVEANGLLNESRNTQLANDLPDGAIVLALETGYKAPINAARAARTGEKVRPPSASPAPIMSRRVVPKYGPPTKAANTADAISIVLSESGRIDMERVANLLGTDEAGAAEKLTEGERPLVYFDPETSRYEPRNAYLSGQVAKKLAAARVAGLEKNVADLLSVQPAKWTAENVTALLGNNWIPTKHYEDFAKHLLGTDSATVYYSQPTNAFSMLVGGYGREKQDQWGTKDMPADAILRGMLNSQLPKVMTEPDENGNRRVDQELSTLVQLKSREIANEFADWVFRDGARRTELVDIYNEKFNTRVTRQHDGTHLTLPGKVPDDVIALRRHQKNAVWRGIYERFMLLDHVVGAGKTFTAIARAMERRRMGLSRKPMVAVPNHLVDQWTQDVYRLYPGAKVLAAGKNQFDKKNRRRLFARIATGDWDLVIVPHSSFGFIGIDPSTEMRFLEHELRIAVDAVREAEENAPEGGGRYKPFTVKQAEKLVEKIQGRMESLKSGNQDRMLTFEQLGVDDLTVDEAHEFKNLFYSSHLSDVRGMGDKSGSKKAFDLYNKVRVLRESPTGTVTFMTGTPISNSAVEMYTMMRYLAAQELKELGIEHFDAWRTQTVSAEPAFEPTDSGGLKEVTRLGRSWSNMRALMELYYTFTDAVSQEDINKWYAEDNKGARFPVPQVKSGGRREVIVKPTAAQTAALVSIVDGFNALPQEKNPVQRNKDRLKLMDAARKVSLDIRAVDPRNASKEVGGKLDQISDNVARIYKETTDDRGTQLIFLDRSVKSAKGDNAIIKKYDDIVAKRDAALAAGDEEGYRKLTDALDEFNGDEIRELKAAQAGGWNAYDQLKENLIKRGIPADQIRFVQEANNDAEKKALFDLVKEGSVRVLIGSTPRMGAGTNVQDRLVALHHADVTWKPSDIEQREGRIIRQGNLLLEKYGDKFAVEIIAYATERTVDAKMWALNSTKLRMINGIRQYDGSFNMEFEDSDAVGMAEIAALASGDPLMLERVKLMAEIEKIEMMERAHRRKMFGIEDQIQEYERIQKQYPGMIQAGTKKAALLNEGVNEMRERAAKRFVRVEGKTFTSMVDAIKAANEAVDLAKGGDENARYSINVDGQRVTSKAAYEEAIENALGDNTGIEVAREDGTTWRRVSQVAKELSTVVSAAIPNLKGDDNQHAGGKLGTLAGFELNWGVSRGRWGDVASLWIEHNGATFAEAEKTLAKNKTINDLGVQSARSIVMDLVDHIRKEREFDPGYYERKVVEAGEELPRLRQNYAQATFAQQGDLDQKRARLYEVVQILDARTKAAERARGAHAAPATDEPLGPDTPAASRARGVSAPDNLSEDQQKIIDNITKIVRYIAGPDIEVRFSDTIGESNFAGWGSAGDGRTLGMYYRSIVELALNQSRDNIVSTALHEAYHHIEAVLQNARELALMTSPREMARMRKTVQRATGFSDKEMNEIAGYEIRALAFEIYGKARIDGNVGKLGLHIGARAFFDKLARIIERVRNMLTGYGFKTAEDVFNKAYTGQYRNQAPVRDAQGWFTRQDREAPLGDIPAAARGPKRFRPVRTPYTPQIPQPHFTPLHTNVRAALNDPNMSRSERLSAALDALTLPAAKKLWDKIIDITRLQQAAETFNGAKTPERLDTQLAATLFPGKAGEGLHDATYNLFHPIYDAMKKHNVDIDELDDFLYARHAKERNDFVGVLHAPGTQFHNAITDHSIVGASGMSTDEAIDILHRMSNRRVDFDAVAALVDAVLQHNRDLMETSGLEHASTLMRWTNAYQYRVPLKGTEAGLEAEFGTPPRGKGFMVRGAESMRALGRRTRADHILVNILDETQRTIIRAEKNTVGKTFARWAMANPNPDVFKFGTGTMRRAINPATGLVELEWINRPVNDDLVFSFKVAGDTHYIEFAKGQEGMVLALKNVGVQHMGSVGRAAMWFTRTYSAFQTARNPEFVINNFLRDIQEAGINLTAEQQAGFELAYLKNLTKGKAFMAAVLGEVGATNNRFGQLYEEWRHDGGKISAYGYKDLVTLNKEARREMDRRLESTTWKVIKTPLRAINPFNGHIVKMFEAISDIMESTTRLAVYAAARDIGLSRAEAARAAREMTVDFSRGGEWAPIIKSLYAFASPAIQGQVNLVRRLRKSRKFRWIYGVGIPSASFMLTLFNLWASPADDDDKEKKLYEGMKHWQRERNIIIYLPGKKDAITPPLSFMAKPAWAIGENAAMVLMGKITALEGFGNMLGQTIQAFNPLGTEGSALDLKWWVKNISPTFLDPLIELGFNSDWLNHPIHPEQRPWNSGVPHSEQSKMTTNTYAQSVAEWLNRVSGGNTFTKGSVDLYPDDLEYVFNFTLGGFGKFLGQGGGYIQDKIDGIDTPVEKLPFVRRWIHEGMSDQSRVEKYYEDHKKAYDDTQAIRRAYRASHADSDNEDAKTTIDALFPKTGAHPTGQYRNGVPTVTSPVESNFRNSDAGIKQLRLEERALRRNRDMPRNERINALKANRKEQVGIMKKARVDYRELQTP